MRKIPTLFVRDPDDMKRVLPQVNPECQWVLDGEGTPTRKFDGTCVALLYTDGEQVSTEAPASGPSLETVDLCWLARREVKPDKQAPENFIPISTDPNTGKTMGWEPIGQSAFAKFHAEALAAPYGVVDHTPGGMLSVGNPYPGTYELVGPRVNGNPEGVDEHLLVRHGYREAVDDEELGSAGRDFDSLREWLLAHPKWEGIVWHCPDGRMAKLKRRDFA